MISSSASRGNSGPATGPTASSRSSLLSPNAAMCCGRPSSAISVAIAAGAASGVGHGSQHRRKTRLGHNTSGVIHGGVTTGVAGAIADDPAMRFDGTSGYIDFGDLLDFPAHAPFFIEA